MDLELLAVGYEVDGRPRRDGGVPQPQRVRADANEPEEAAATAQRVLTLSADVASERTAERVRVVLARLAAYADPPEVRAVIDAS
ncbi:hypothetical protein [Streptomyces sp. NPDC047315]|uniref:hypothetical protein n=1 Tax=Streptomyces sp. NPDC047315 TaxID=3155142 RepID=UPI0033E12BF0